MNIVYEHCFTKWNNPLLRDACTIIVLFSKLPFSQFSHCQLQSQVELTMETRQLHRQRQSLLSTYVVRPASVVRQKRLNNPLLKMIVRDVQPFSIVDDPGFRDFVAALDPPYQLPSWRTIMPDLLPTAYNTCVGEVQALMETIDAVCLTTDSYNWKLSSCDSSLFRRQFRTWIVLVRMYQVRWETHCRQPCYWAASYRTWMEGGKEGCPSGHWWYCKHCKCSEDSWL